MHVWVSWIVVVLGLLSSAVRAAPRGDCAIELVNVTSRSGIDFQHTDGGSGRQYLVELVVGGLALFDYDGDGWIDIYLLNGAPRQGTVTGELPRNALYRNNGDGTYKDVTAQAGVGDTGHGLGVTVGDYDNDGDADLYVNNYGPNVLYRNNGDGTFRDVTPQAGVGCGDKVGAGACFLDIDSDGDLDLYVAHYVDFSFARHEARSTRSFPYPPGPKDYPPVPDTLFRNNGDGTFDDVSVAAGITSVAGPGMGTICLNYDQDQDTDIFVCNDGAANFLFRNDGTGRFEEVALLAGVAYDGRGEANGSMGVDCGDFDTDGRLDLFMTDYTSEMPVLYRNLGRGLFEDAANSARAGAAVFPHTNWGTGLIDFDNDGDRDLFVANGHFLRNIKDINDSTSYRVRNCLLMNTNDSRFVDVSNRCGDGLAVVESSRGVAFDDLDNDGDVDAVVLNANAAPTILENRSATENRWLQIRLRGSKNNRDGVGSRVQVVAGDLVQIAEVHSGRGYQSHFGTRLHFGLATQPRVDRVEVFWLGGGVEVFRDVPLNQLIVLTEGAGEKASSGGTE